MRQWIGICIGGVFIVWLGLSVIAIAAEIPWKHVSSSSGDLDILNKPYTWETPRVDVWLNGQK